MTIDEGYNKLHSFISKADRDHDPYLLVHFSRIADEYRGYDNNIDAVDAIIIIEDLVKMFDIDPEALYLTLRRKTQVEENG